MLKDELFEKVLKGRTLARTEWIIKAFSIFKEDSQAWEKDPYEYRIVFQPNGWHFVDPENNNKLTLIEDAPLGTPIYKALDPFTVRAGVVENASKDYETTYGNALINKICLSMWFGSRIEFMTGVITPKRLSANIPNMLTDDVPVEQRANDKIYVDEFLKFCKAAYSLVAYTQVFTPAATRKSMQSPPDIVMYRDILVKENEGRLHDPAVVADIAKKLQEYDAEYLRGDRSLKFLLKDKSLKIVRTKLFLMYGADPGLEQKVDVRLIEKSLSEGWDLDKLPDMIDSIRAGSYNRGKETENGGARVKEIYRAAGNLKITVEDCGSELGLPYLSDPKKPQQLIGFTLIDENKRQIKIDETNVGSYLGKVIRLRSPMYCKSSDTDYCQTCCGDRLSEHPNALAMEFTAYGSKFMDMFMQAAHAKALTVRELDYNRLLF